MSVYTPTTADAWKETIEIAAIRYASLELAGPIRLEALFIFKRPKPRGSEHYVTTKPDIDNILKAAMDALTRIKLWADDCQVSSIAVEKVYQDDEEEPGLVMRVFEWAEAR